MLKVSMETFSFLSLYFYAVAIIVNSYELYGDENSKKLNSYSRCFHTIYYLL